MNYLRRLRMIRPQLRRQDGDTIVEVLICVLIVSLILGGAYTTVQRSAVGIRNSQEHAEVLKLLQAQVEQLRTNASTGGGTIFTANMPFCMSDGVPVSTKQQPGAAKCAQDSSGKPGTTEPLYNMSITRANSGGGVLFTIRADWAAITGTPAQETIFYRLQR